MRPARPRHWRLGPGATIPLDRPRLLAILNITPDSFSDGGAYADPRAAADAAERFAHDGADAIDVGGESTRPGAAAVPAEEQARRVVPVIRAIRAGRGPASRLPVTIDTTDEAVARAAIDAGADAINDISAGLDSSGRTLTLAASMGRGIILMHRPRRPSDDRYSDQDPSPPRYTDPAGEVLAFLVARARAALDAGIAPDAIALDPGLGFGKSVADNLALIEGTPRLASPGFPIVSGLSRKSFVGRVSLGRDSTPSERLEGTLALSVTHFLRGASIFRVHDAGPHARALAAAHALLEPPGPPPRA
ncbi:MAG: dihydropteroate synthase [Phycisphaeraceae bacterium]|nr:MAG: dihydropteroate synthase [Phycisphaeraceae bacterium]